MATTSEPSPMSAIAATPPIVVGFLLSFGGIAFVLFSRNVGRKRLVLPITLVLFSALWWEIFRESSASTAAVLGVMAVALIANGMWVYKHITYCSTCGRTLQDRPAGGLCAECAAAI